MRSFLSHTFLLLLFLSIVASAYGKQFIVVIDPGHGGGDPGAIGAISQEKSINLEIAKKVGNLIKENHKDVKVIYTRTTDKKLKPIERAEFANRQNADLFISIHTNAMENKKMKGTETYIYGTPSGREAIDVEKLENAGAVVSGNASLSGNFQQNKLLAQEIQNAFKKEKRIDKGVKKARFIVLKYTKMPAVLVEIGYISNANEEKYMNSAAGQKAIAKSIYTAFSNYKKKQVDKSAGKKNKNNQSEKKQDKAPAKPDVKKSPDKKDTSTKKQQTQSKKKITYRVQFLLSDRKLPKNSPKFKGLTPVEYYEEKGLYKYTYGNSSNLKEIQKKQKEAKKLFGDAFIVIFEDGKRIGVYGK